jgi:hypothetical protein
MLRPIPVMPALIAVRLHLIPVTQRLTAVRLALTEVRLHLIPVM